MSAEHDEVRQRFAHALLERVHGDAESTDRERVQRALGAIPGGDLRDGARRASRAGTTARRIGGWVPRLVAAGLALAVVWWAAGPGAPPAAASVVERALAAVRSNDDRHYSIAADDGGDELRPVADVYIRGGDQFALRFARPGGRSMWTGYDGIEGWRIPAPSRMAVRVSSDPAVMKARILDRNSDLPFLELESALVTIRDLYVLSTVSEPALGGAPDPSLLHVRAIADDRTPPDMPRQIDLAVRREDGVIQSLVASRESSLRPRLLILRLLDEEARPDGWYGFEAHIAPGRRVRRY
ncbi:MAG: hypothetical protein AAFZ87_06965 [Planctomycetota bacterium]